MPTNVFNASEGDPTIIRANRAVLSLGTGGGSSGGNGGGELSFLAVNVRITFQRNVEQVPVIGSRRVLSMSEPSGTMQIGSLITDNGDAMDQILEKDNVGGNGAQGCKPFELDVDLSGDGTCGMGGKKIKLYGCITSAISIEMQGGRGYVASGVTVSFTRMDI